MMASAASLDLLEFANFSEQDVTSGTAITDPAFDNKTITISANPQFNEDDRFPYFDHGGAGLGGCPEVPELGTGPNGMENRCIRAGDDNIRVGEAVTIGFDGLYALSDVQFTGEGHTLANPTFLRLENPGRFDNTFLFATNGSDQCARYTFDSVFSATFAFDGLGFTVADARGLAENAAQFYLASAVISPVPVPAALPMLLAGLGGMAWVGRRRKTS